MSTHVSIKKLLILLAATLMMLPAISASDNHNFDTNICLPQEKVYLHFDNTSYYHGDKIWFKAYVVLAPTHGMTPLSQTLYVELLNPGGKVIEKKTLRITNGQCHSDFTLSQLPFYSGYYEVRAYTKYMLNFGDDVVFSRVFPIFDHPAKDGDYTDRRIMKNSGVKYGTERPAVKKPKKLDVRFYPEGGYIIAGIPCRIAFEALGRDGSVDDCSGIVVERQSDAVVANMTPTADGRGVFTLLAAEGKSYYAKIDHDGKTYTFDLPTAKKAESA